MWKYISNEMFKHSMSKINSRDVNRTYSELIHEVNENIENIENIISYDLAHMKIVIITENPIYTMIGVFVSWGLKGIAVPLSLNYGSENCRKSIDVIKPDLIITDCLKLSIISEMDVDIYDIKTHSYYQHSKLKNKGNGVDENVVLIMCTSGTTGMPKGVMIKKEGLITNICDICDYFDLSCKDKILIARPLYHCAVLTGELLVALSVGADIVFFTDGYNPAEMSQFILDEKITVMGGTPNLFYHLGKILYKTTNNIFLKKIAISGECMTQEIAISIKKFFPYVDIYNVYGLTEASPRVCYLPPQFFDRYPESVGIPLKHVRCKILSENGNEVGKGEVGILYVSGISIMAGYYDQEKLTNQVLENGWLKTRDIACYNEKGFICIKGRSDDMIIKAGMNIYPKEIENVVRKISFIDEAAAIGVKATMGDKIVLFVVLRELRTKKEVMLLLAKMLPKYQMPEEIIFLDKLPQNASQKIDRKELRILYERESR